VAAGSRASISSAGAILGARTEARTEDRVRRIGGLWGGIHLKQVAEQVGGRHCKQWVKQWEEGLAPRAGR
jgi:hypothetical protein